MEMYKRKTTHIGIDVVYIPNTGASPDKYLKLTNKCSSDRNLVHTLATGHSTINSILILLSKLDNQVNSLPHTKVLC